MGDARRVAKRGFIKIASHSMPGHTLHSAYRSDAARSAAAIKFDNWTTSLSGHSRSKYATGLPSEGFRVRIAKLKHLHQSVPLSMRVNEGASLRPISQSPPCEIAWRKQNCCRAAICDLCRRVQFKSKIIFSPCVFARWFLPMKQYIV